MQIVECPHCRTRVANDGSLSLIVVTCPGCLKTFQMPALEPPVAPPAPPEDDSSDLGGEDSFSSRRRRKKPRGPSLWIAVLGSTALFWALVFVVLWAAGYGPFHSSEPNEKAGKKKQVEPKSGEPRSESPSTRQPAHSTDCVRPVFAAS